MSVGLFTYPEQALFGRTLPKTKIYEHTKLTKTIRTKFINQIERIVWQYKLAPETINLASKKSAPEIELFVISLKTPEISPEVLRAIDNAIPFPIIYELIFGRRIKIAAAFKRTSEADSAKWVTYFYFESDWQQMHIARKPLPVALDIAGLYEQMLRELMGVPARKGETISQQVERVGLIRAKQYERALLEARLRNEKQFNRKVDLNAQLRGLNKEIEALSAN
jgi:uncharacterized protein DUF4391